MEPGAVGMSCFIVCAVCALARLAMKMREKRRKRDFLIMFVVGLNVNGMAVPVNNFYLIFIDYGTKLEKNRIITK